MIVSVFIALFLTCSLMTAVFLVYISLLWCSGRQDNSSRDPEAADLKGLSSSDIQKLPKVTGKDYFVLGGGTDCAVCLDEIGKEEAVRSVPGCNHGFHLECVDRWLAKNRICPVCRAKLPPDHFNSLPNFSTSKKSTNLSANY